jgi:hypothetical protein
MVIANADLDALILAACTTQWQKVAMIIAKVMQAGERNGIKIDEVPIARRVRKLVKEEKLQAQGNLMRVRYSEVKLPG